MQQPQFFGQTLNGQFFQIIGGDTNLSMGRFVDVVKGVAMRKILGMFHIYVDRCQWHLDYSRLVSNNGIPD